MATSRENFALDWIKGELLETLNTARTGLESFAEALENGEPLEAAAADEPLRDCVNALHQVHGTLVMLELSGVTLLADHLERLAAALREQAVGDVPGACQTLMQGILELPGYLDELQAGLPDSDAPMLGLVNELRGLIDEAPLKPSSSGVRLYGVAGDAALQRFSAINGVDKTRKIRGVYQQVLLSLLKGADLDRAVETLRKVAQGMGKVCEGTPFEAQWQAFGEFVEGLAGSASSAPLDGEAVKLLRRVDSEIREIAQSGTAALQRPVAVNLVRQLIDAATARGRSSELLDALGEAAAQGDQSSSMSLSGRQAMVSAAMALREELGSVKDRLDLFVRGGHKDVAALGDLLAPLKQVSSTLSLLGFESSTSIVLDQVQVLDDMVEAGAADEPTILGVAGALVQVDENLASLTQGGKGEVEKITDEAQRAVALQTRDGLEQIKQSIVDYVSAQWDVRHLQETPGQLDGIAGALAMIPLNRAAELVNRCQNYVRLELMAGHVPSWEELDRLADALSGIDYYLERLASENPGGAEDVLDLAERSLAGLGSGRSAEAEPVASGDAADAVTPGAGADSPSDEFELALEPLDSEPGGEPAAASDRETAADTASNVEPLFGAAEDVDAGAVSGDAGEEPELQFEMDDDFDLSSELFDDIDQAAAASGPAEGAGPAQEGATADTAGADVELEREFDDDSGAGSTLAGRAAPDSADDVADHGSAGVGMETPADWAAGAPASDDEPAPESTFELEALEDLAEDLSEPGAGLSAPGAAEDDAAAEDRAAGEDDALSEADAPAEGPAPEQPADNRADEPAAAATAELGTAAAARTAGLSDSFDSDEDIVEIFSEEVDEVLATIDEYLAAWPQALDDDSCQTEIRRAFHTLKGSGRMVGANVLGEMAWSVENMLNRVLDGTVAPSDEFPLVVGEARALTPVLRDAFEARQAPEMASVGRVMERADVLASGGTLAETGDLEAPAPEAALSADAVADDSDLFADEAQINIETLAAASRDGVFVLDDHVLRALHTLSGSAAMAGLASVGELAAPTYDLAQALRSADGETTLDGEQADYFRQATDAMALSLADMRADREPEDHYQLIAEADRLLMAASQEGAASGTAELMGLPALASMLKAPELLEGWHDGAVDLALADEIRNALAEIERLTAAEDRTAIATLAGALRRAHERFEFESLDADALAAFSAGHDRLLEQFDAMAAGQTTPAFADVGAALDALAPTPYQETGYQGAGDAGASDHAVDIEAFDFEAVGFTPGRSRLDEPEDIPTLEENAEVEENLDDIFVTPADAAVGESAAAGETAASAHEQEDAGESAASEIEPAAASGDSASAEPTSEEPPGADDPSAGGVAARPGLAGTGETAASRMPAGPAASRPDDVDAEIIEVFFEEADELLEAMDQDINDWQEAPENRLHLENLLRALHTLKGGARLSGLTALGDRTHEFESFLIEFQSSGRDADPQLFDELHTCYDAIAGLVGEVRARFAGTAEAAGDEPAAETSAAAASTTEAALPDADQLPEPAAARGGNVAPLRRPMEEPDPAPADAAAETAAQARAQEMVRVGAGLLESLVNLAGESSIIRARVEQGMSDFTGALDEMETTIERLREQLRRLEIETETQVLFRRERIEAPAYDDFDPLEMDRYSQLQQLSRALGESASDMLDLKETLLYKAREAETLLLQQARVNTELQEGLMRSRMVPFSRLVPRLKRTVRQVAKELDKDVELHTFNVEGELDRSLLERMVPPLEHMLRNAVDHGIEKPDRRRSTGKAEAGRIDLRLAREGGDVVIEISDDGAGIDVERVRAKAIERGLLARDAELREDEISQFVLAPGFSTADSVTQISGRGVGMDVVHSEVKQLGGSISIFSQPGRGTRFVLRVPFTVSVNRALMVAVGDDLYAIPLNTIEGIVLLAPDELDRLYAPDGKTFEYAGVPYRIQYLGQFLGREYHPQPLRGSVPVVLVRSGEHAVAVHVDGVQGSREIVVKSLGPQFAGVGGISGATILGDGSVVVILDLLALIRTQGGGGLAAGRRTRAGAARTRCVMVVDDSVTVRKVTSRLLERQGMDVVVAKDGVEAVSLLQERRPDVMLLDIEMPRMDGFEVLRQVRHDERLRDLPIVMISSRTGTKHQERAADLGVSRFLGKPFQESELLATIDDLVN